MQKNATSCVAEQFLWIELKQTIEVKGRFCRPLSVCLCGFAGDSH